MSKHLLKVVAYWNAISNCVRQPQTGSNFTLTYSEFVELDTLEHSHTRSIFMPKLALHLSQICRKRSYKRGFIKSFFEVNIHDTFIPNTASWINPWSSLYGFHFPYEKFGLVVSNGICRSLRWCEIYWNQSTRNVGRRPHFNVIVPH